MDGLDVDPGFSVFPQKHTCNGENISPKIGIRGLQTPYLAIILEDPDAPGGTYTHWLIWNVDATGTLPEGLPAEREMTDPIAAVQGTNDHGSIGYFGPCPPRETTHRFFFRVYGMREAIDLEPGAGRVAFEDALKDVIEQYGEAMAAYGRKVAAWAGA
ncbi:YbhB/YbcL family Raf kinase inhibitor-like protein [Methanoculleus sp. FWC-SCC1]|uniref:YbhB/YbcL family Raf kinase inhibitor-like protein n=1 Tax=Methanoculleus frigidifontis TaxID=2584085 RepID=A0ABT8M9M4_9EURY|nr:YbhB/YbcL family Raf kinase inhibitor-like protein [Methanoculleus sp. FWC-SCC1]MDN7024638.1 YbhB/YbcL family Raf kinase inhibitor-like protein [Methanoculleus sp. FWC-SCC1]